MLGLTDPGAGPRDRAIDRALHRTIAKVTADLETYHFNTAIAAMMELSNALQHASGPSRADAVDKLILLLAPFAPHIAEELWHRRGGTGTVHRQTWPAYDATLAAADEITLVIQIDGKVRERIPAPAGMSIARAEELARANPKVRAALTGRDVDRVVVVPDRIVNIVTRRRS